LEANIRWNGFEDRICPSRVAVSGSTGEMELYAMEGDTGGSTAFPSIHPWWFARGGMKQIKVKCVTLHDIFQANNVAMCDCLKIDCEGSEYEIVSKADKEDLRRIKSIIMEYHPNGRVEVIGKLLEEVGFSVEIASKRSVMFAWMSQPL